MDSCSVDKHALSDVIHNLLGKAEHALVESVAGISMPFLLPTCTFAEDATVDRKHWEIMPYIPNGV